MTESTGFNSALICMVFAKNMALTTEDLQPFVLDYFMNYF